jgi:hypothetical protein
MTGISSLFPAFPKQMSILDRVNINVARHKNYYFKNNNLNNKSKDVFDRLFFN